MTEFSLNFKKFIDSDWLRWKNDILREAEEETAAKFPGGFGALRQPILFDEDDWRFLSQFPPNFWARAINWRYGDGLLQAAEARERSKEKGYEEIPNEVENIEFKDSDGKSAIFPNVYVGLRDLMQKLERPVISHMGYKPNLEGIPYKFDIPDGPSLDELNFSPEEIEGLKDPKEYKGGVYDMDLTKPIMLSKKFVDSLPDDHYLLMQIDPNSERDPQAAKKARAKLAKRYANSFASMPAMRYEVAVEQLQNWIRASGLGLLGDTPETLKGPRGTEARVAGKLPPSEFYGKWPEFVGQQDGVKWDDASGTVEARQIPLSLPYVKRNIVWYETDRSGKNITKRGGEIPIPVLNPGKLLPLISPTAEQREALKRRRAKEDDTGQIGELRQVLDNWDLLSQEQKDAFQAGTMTLTELAARKMAPGYRERFGKEGRRKGEDFYAAGGWHAQKSQRGRGSLNMTKEQLEAVLDQYLPANSEKLKLDFGAYNDDYCSGQGGFVGEACRGVTYFMKKDLEWKGYKGSRRSDTPGKFEMAKASVLKMMEQGMPEIINTAAALLALEANDHRYGVYDPELGLNKDNPELGEKSRQEAASIARILKSYNVARDLAQAAMFGGQSRRQRASGKGYELTGGGGEEGNFGDDIAAGADIDDIRRKRQELAAQMGAQQPRTWYAYRTDVASRPQWLVPTLTPKLAQYLETLRTEIKSRVDGVAGTDFAKNVTDIAEISAMIDNAANQLIEDRLAEFEAKGLIDKKAYEENPEKIRELLDKSIDPDALEEKLRKDYPDTFGKDMTSSRIKELMGNRGKDGDDAKPTVAASAEDAMAQQTGANPDQIERVLSGFRELQFELQDANETNFVNALLSGRPAKLYAVALNGEDAEDPQILGIDRNQELPDDTPELVVYDQGITAQQLVKSIDEYKGLRNLFALMGYTKSQTAQVMPEFLQRVFNMSPQQASQEMQKMGLGAAPAGSTGGSAAPAPVGAAANIITQVGQWILDPSDTESFGEIGTKLKQIFDTGIRPEDLKPYYQQLYSQVEKKLQSGDQPTKKELALIQYLSRHIT